MEEERIAYQVFNSLCSLTQPDRDTVAAHQIPLVTFFCVSVYGGPARGIGTDLERFRIKIPDYFCLSTYQQLSRMNGQPAAVIAVYQAPGANALATANSVK